MSVSQFVYVFYTQHCLLCPQSGFLEITGLWGSSRGLLGLCTHTSAGCTPRASTGSVVRTHSHWKEGQRVFQLPGGESPGLCFCTESGNLFTTSPSVFLRLSHCGRWGWTQLFYLSILGCSSSLYIVVGIHLGGTCEEEALRELKNLNLNH